MTKKGARQGCIAIQPLHLRHGAGVGRAGRGAGRTDPQARCTGGAGARHGLRHYDTAAWGCDMAREPGHDTAPVRAWARLCAPGHAGWAVCAHCAFDSVFRLSTVPESLFEHCS